jgi:hypothetical protein
MLEMYNTPVILKLPTRKKNEMGLDNFPRNYPCKTQGTAVMTQRKNHEGTLLTREDGSPDMVIDCDATTACGQCPYKNAFDKSGLDGGAVYGMFGTPCWYRGKYGNHLLNLADIDTDQENFYGDNEDGTEKSAQSCEHLADTISEALMEHAGHLIVDGEDYADELRYAEWYLRWASEECDGLGAWY